MKLDKNNTFINKMYHTYNYWPQIDDDTRPLEQSIRDRVGSLIDSRELEDL